MPTHNRHYLDPTTKRHNPAALARVGAMLEVVVNIPQTLIDFLAAQNQPFPAPVKGVALIDTGASRTCADRNILATLGISPIGIVTSGTPAGPIQCPLYPAKMDFPALRMTVDFSSVVGVDLQGQFVDKDPIVVLIGRDILTRGLLFYNGGGGFYTLALS